MEGDGHGRIKPYCFLKHLFQSKLKRIKGVGQDYHQMSAGAEKKQESQPKRPMEREGGLPCLKKKKQNGKLWQQQRNPKKLVGAEVDQNSLRPRRKREQKLDYSNTHFTAANICYSIYTHRQKIFLCPCMVLVFCVLRVNPRVSFEVRSAVKYIVSQ
mmetsp:Transcript_25/g.26  ORF Transcript_25/g.26 Transcript_25/m.26 type:complete len:157 (+) Transcript_25:141-611(+)